MIVAARFARRYHHPAASREECSAEIPDDHRIHRATAAGSGRVHQPCGMSLQAQPSCAHQCACSPCSTASFSTTPSGACASLRVSFQLSSITNFTDTVVSVMAGNWRRQRTPACRAVPSCSSSWRPVRRIGRWRCHARRPQAAT